jgi:hypothetical protein
MLHVLPLSVFAYVASHAWQVILRLVCNGKFNRLAPVLSTCLLFIATVSLRRLPLN